MYSKSTPTGLTQFHALYLNSSNQSVQFQYHPEGLPSGYRTINVPGVNFADGSFHHVAVSVYGNSFALFVDGVLLGKRYTLDAALEDGSGVLYLGRTVMESLRFSGNRLACAARLYYQVKFIILAGLMYSAYYFNASLSNQDIQTLAQAGIASFHVQPECRCPPAYPVAAELLCFDPTGLQSVPRVNLSSHNAALINDQDTTTWWQSANAVSEVNVTVALGGLREVLVFSAFFQLLPYSAVLYYSTDGQTFLPRQFYAADCSVFGLTNNGPLTSLTDVNCINTYSYPLSNWYLNFYVLDVGNRPGANNVLSVNQNPSLQRFAAATHVRLRLFSWQPQQSVQSYSVFELYAYGQACICNGHASACNGSVCLCQHNTAGAQCDRCLPLYNNKPWQSGNATSTNACEACQCNGHAVACAYDGILFGGICSNCSDNTAGNNCEQCAPFYYHPQNDSLSSKSACLPCGCYTPGVTNGGDCSRDAATSGQCACKSFVTGRACDQCVSAYYNLTSSNPGGCQSCGCNAAGTVGASAVCDPSTGQCPCKPNVKGRDCSACLSGYYGIENAGGCLPCDQQCLECTGPTASNCLVSGLFTIVVAQCCCYHCIFVAVQ